jgi:hypothetical protein
MFYVTSYLIHVSLIAWDSPTIKTLLSRCVVCLVVRLAKALKTVEKSGLKTCCAALLGRTVLHSADVRCLCPAASSVFFGVYSPELLRH